MNLIRRQRFTPCYSVLVRKLSNVSPNHNINVKFEDKTGVLNLGEGEKRFSNEFMKDFHLALDEVESNTECKSLITTADGKFFSNGLDLDFLLKQDDNGTRKYFKDVRKLFERILTFPVPTLAALNGHSFAAGAILAFSHDFRYMRKDRGWISLNEIFIHLRFHHFLFMILRAKIPPGQAQNEAIIYGKRFTGPEAKDYCLINAVVDQNNLLSDSINLMKMLENNNYKRSSMNIMKCDLYNDILSASDDYYKYK
ncbi:hypothetical protein LOTGIDRAFT_232141 [Lottia gigantea]|uniref:Uncharacterized protein n=1 Tax=Lottia gigantea TaxID=225164 RepID=V4AJU7_LOTGI|nr:hypothetical protein LOTGIDRAFT_232141 [Lottia gigantea]ESO95000.1 hypothetical protein LOTGIDRAFT_232141 [Lottia gigantea]